MSEKTKKRMSKVKLSKSIVTCEKDLKDCILEICKLEKNLDKDDIRTVVYICNLIETSNYKTKQNEKLNKLDLCTSIFVELFEDIPENVIIDKKKLANDIDYIWKDGKINKESITSFLSGTVLSWVKKRFL